jgi:predicted ATP-dependent endonuclease of OLD family
VRISRLQVECFRSIRSIDVQLPQICALVGPNNAGKSNILHAIKRVLQPDYGPRVTDFDEADVHGRDPTKDIDICLTFDPPLRHAKLQGVEPVQIPTLRFCWDRGKRGDKKGERRLQQFCLKADGTAPAVQKTHPRKGQPPTFEPVIGVPQEVRQQIPFIWIGTERSLRDQLPSARWSMLRRMFEEIDHELHSPADTVEVDGQQVPRADRFEKLLHEALKLLRTGGFEKLEASIKKHALDYLGLDADEDRVDLYFTPMRSLDFYKALDLLVNESGFEISATRMGEGMQNAIVLAILRAFEETRRKGAIIAIEEPEMFLHPQMQRSLYDSLERLGESNQVIYSTHSPHFVSVADFKNVAVVRKDKELGTTVTQSDFEADERKVEWLRQMFDSDRAELFFAKRVLIVEGPTESLVVPVYADRFGIDLDGAGATVINSGGKSAVLDLAKIAISFGIPTGIVYDVDGGDDPLNAELEALASDGVRIWSLDPDYEKAASAEVGEDRYREIMDRYPPSAYGKSKSRRARMAAADDDMRPPAKLLEAIQWLGVAKPKPEPSRSGYDAAEEAAWAEALGAIEAWSEGDEPAK